MGQMRPSGWFVTNRENYSDTTGPELRLQQALGCSRRITELVSNPQKSVRLLTSPSLTRGAVSATFQPIREISPSPTRLSVASPGRAAQGAQMLLSKVVQSMVCQPLGSVAGSNEGV